MLTVTFYSFRGGVGRTMALANVAAHLARNGLKVFLIDFDLEAPGLSLMPELQPVEEPSSAEGLIGYLRAGLADSELPAVETLSYETKLSVELREADKNAETIHLLPAGTTRSPHRGQDLAHLHLEQLYKNNERSLVIDALKVQIEDKYQPDYLLVDSRTGLTDVGGICTVHLADLLVIVSGLNRQNIEGTSMVVRSLCAARKDFSENVLFAISPVPIGEESLKAERLAIAAREFADAMGSEEDLSNKLMTVPYHPQVALTEDCFVKHHADSPLAQAYREVAESIRDRNPKDLPKQFSRIMHRFENGDQQAIPELLELADMPRAPSYSRLLAATVYFESGELESAERLLMQLASEDPGSNEILRLWGDVLSSQAQAKEDAEADRLFDEAGQKYSAALEVKRDDYVALYSWGNVLSAHAKVKQGAYADRLFDLASQKYEAALQIKPDFHEVLNNWGNVLRSQAEMREGSNADRLFDLASQKFAAALEIKPDKYMTLNNWGLALSAQAQTKDWPEADPLYVRAGEKFAAALEVKPDFYHAFYNWGNALLAYAKTKETEEADRLFDMAGEKFAAALSVRHDFHQAFYNWGNALAAQAQTKLVPDATRLFELAAQKYAGALEIKPDRYDALNNWGNVLSDLAKLKEGAEADKLFDLAGKKFAAALEIDSGTYETLYNWGIALLDQARTKHGEEADRLFSLAQQKLAAALEIKPDFHRGLLYWGNVLLAQGGIKQGAEAQRLIELACQKYAAANEINPGNHEILNNWGNALSDQAKARQDADADRLFDLASQKYAEALRIKPEDYTVLNNWGLALLNRAKAKQDAEAERLLVLASEKCNQANQISDGSGSYNLACIAALRGQSDECRHWLENSRATGQLPTREHLLEDPDLDSARDDDWFREFVKA